MSIPTIRYESNNLFTAPLELGIRHFRLATCDGSQATLLHFARERIIHRPRERHNNVYEPLTTQQRAFHIIVAALETLGYLTVVLPFITAIVDRLLNEPWYIPGGPGFRTHMQEGGTFLLDHSVWRRNPFHQHGGQDPFYQGASWLPRTQ